MEHAVDVDRYCSEVISLLLLMYCKGKLAHLCWSIEGRRVRSGVLHQALGGAHLILKLFERQSHTLPGNTQPKPWIQNARSLHSLQMEALALKQK